MCLKLVRSDKLSYTANATWVVRSELKNLTTLFLAPVLFLVKSVLTQNLRQQDSENISSCLGAIFEEPGSNLFFNAVSPRKKGRWCTFRFSKHFRSEDQYSNILQGQSTNYFWFWGPRGQNYFEWWWKGAIRKVLKRKRPIKKSPSVEKSNKSSEL